MYTPLLLFAVLAPAPFRSAEPSQQPADVDLPSDTFLEPGPFIGGGCHSGGGIFFPDGSTLAATIGGWRNQLDIVYRKPCYEDVCFRTSLFAGTQVGIRSECYLGYGFAARFDLGTPFLARAGLDWYLFKGVTLSLEGDLLMRRLQGGWIFQP